jgi:histidyl-tRNA synthetase
MPAIVKPTPISGFPEFLPAEQILFARMIEIIKTGFERYGFSPIETPAVERKDVLTSKAGIEKEIYALSRLTAEDGESADTDLALHFDLTVPLARYVAMYKEKLTFPFRRYQIQKAWRGERAQAGRYREFYQCDIDVIGRGALSPMTDAEIPSIIYQIFCDMNIGPFVIRVNNRKILQGYFQHLTIPTEKMVEAMRTIDKIEKIGKNRLVRELSGRVGLEESTTTQLMEFLEGGASNEETLDKPGSIADSNSLLAEGVHELRAVVDGMRALGVPDEYVHVDMSVARGLDYYTGTVYETVLTDHPKLGSICSGGRYDDLAGYFTEETFPGVGVSIGLSRLIPRLIEAGVLQTGAATVAPVLVTAMDETRMLDYLRIGAMLREAGIATEVYLEQAKLGAQLRYASRKGFHIAIIAGESEFAQSAVKVKNLLTGEETTHPTDNFVAHVGAILGAATP